MVVVKMNLSKAKAFGVFALNNNTVFCQQIVVLERLRPPQSGTQSHLYVIQKWSPPPQQRSPLEPVSLAGPAAKPL